MEWPLRKHRRESRRDQKRVAVPHGDFQLFGQMKHHLAAGQRASCLHETQMARGNIGLAGQIELAFAAALAPIPQMGTDMVVLDIHGAMLGRTLPRDHNLKGNGQPAMSGTACFNRPPTRTGSMRVASPFGPVCTNTAQSVAGPVAGV
jgi:hypothetical protein